MSIQGNAGGTDQSPTLLKSTQTPENSAPVKLTAAPENFAYENAEPGKGDGNDAAA